MAKYKVEFNRAYLKDLKKVPVRSQKQIIEKINELSNAPRPEGCKKLQGSSAQPLYRIRCGDYRIVYTIEDSRLLILVVSLGHRREIYRSL